MRELAVVILYCHAIFWRQRDLGGGGGGLVEMSQFKNNANCLCFKRLSIYISNTLNPEIKCNHDLYVSKC